MARGTEVRGEALGGERAGAGGPRLADLAITDGRDTVCLSHAHFSHTHFGDIRIHTAAVTLRVRRNAELYVRLQRLSWRELLTAVARRALHTDQVAEGPPAALTCLHMILTAGVCVCVCVCMT